jgi:hypothetical protein
MQLLIGDLMLLWSLLLREMGVVVSMAGERLLSEITAVIKEIHS